MLINTTTQSSELPSAQQLLAQQSELIQTLQKENRSLQRKLDWFQRQLFGRKSEQRLEDSPMQSVFEGLFEEPVLPPSEADECVPVKPHQRRKKGLAGTPADSGLRFDEHQVPVKVIEIQPDELRGQDADQYEIIRHEVRYKLAQTRASYEVLKYTRPVLKDKRSLQMITPPAPVSVFDNSVADVSFVAGMLIDKFVYHLPLYRQHQRLRAAGIELSRTTLTNLTEKAALLLTPIAQAVYSSILMSQHLALDETPTRAGRRKAKGAKRGQMRTGYYWPLYGEQDEVYFYFNESRASHNVFRLLGDYPGILLTDGYAAYEQYAAKTASVTHAQCWSHTRRHFEKALDDEPDLAHLGLDLIGALYAHEDIIKKRKLDTAQTVAYRGEYSKAIIDKFFMWCTQLVDRPDLVATDSPILEAVNYALKRERGLQVFLDNPDVPLDTNHLERALRVIPCGRKNWLFSWTEVGAHYVGVIQTLLCTCKLQGVDPYTYLVDVLQRVAIHPHAKVDELTPRRWKDLFAGNPMKSDIDL